ncbi:hypothetical protein Gotur_008430 [Gossypium turneri]
MRHSGGLCLRVQGTHAPSFRCDRERSIACFSKWIEAVGQIGGGTKRCPKAVGSHYSSRVRKQAWFWGKISLGLPSLRKGAYVKRITRKMLMAMTTTIIVVIENHELGRGNPRGKGTS